MRHPVSTAAFIIALLLAVGFITTTATGLPPLVAAHFDTAGNPNGFLARGDYVHFMLYIGVAVPMVMVAILTFVNTRKIKLKLPHGDYWMAPSRVAETRALLVGHSVWFGTLFIALICYVHWLVLKAHQQAPPHLPGALALGGIATFVLLASGWALVLLAVFRRPPR